MRLSRILPRPSPCPRAVLLLSCTLVLAGDPAVAELPEMGSGAAVEPETGSGASSEPETPAPADDYDPLFDDEPPTDIPDPIEATNRAVLEFNLGVDRLFWKPVINGVRAVVPGPIRTAFGNALWNLDSPAVLVNDLLQGRPEMAARAFGRLLINTTVGLGGLMDPASAIGLERHQSDFGQTLGYYGVGAGPYLVVPLAGPASVRDGFGGVVDSLMNPLTYVIGPGGDLILGVVFLNFGRGIAMQENYREKLEALRESSVDYYSTLRSLYVQNRQGAIDELKERQAEPAPPDSVRPGLAGPRAAAMERSPGPPRKLRRHRRR